MAKQRISLENGLEQAVNAAADILESGGVVIFPTETVYGVGVVGNDAQALEKLRALKQRDAAKPFQFLAADLDMAKKLGAVVPARAQKLARNYWPGPLTLVVPDGTGTGTLGIRIPASPFALALCARLDRAIVSSSANPAGGPPPLTADSADAFGDGADLLVDGGDIVGGVPSTVVKCLDDDYEILRHGALSDEAIETAWRE